MLLMSINYKYGFALLLYGSVSYYSHHAHTQESGGGFGWFGFKFVDLVLFVFSELYDICTPAGIDFTAVRTTAVVVVCINPYPCSDLAFRRRRSRRAFEPKLAPHLTGVRLHSRAVVSYHTRYLGCMTTCKPAVFEHVARMKIQPAACSPPPASITLSSLSYDTYQHDYFITAALASLLYVSYEDRTAGRGPALPSTPLLPPLPAALPSNTRLFLPLRLLCPPPLASRFSVHAMHVTRHSCPLQRSGQQHNSSHID